MSITGLILALLPAIAVPKPKPDPDLARLTEENARLRAENDLLRLRDRFYQGQQQAQAYHNRAYENQLYHQQAQQAQIAQYHQNVQQAVYNCAPDRASLLR